MKRDFLLIKRYQLRPMRILLSGSNGLIGSALKRVFLLEGHEVVPLVRSSQKKQQGIFWDPSKGYCNLSDFEGFDLVIHLAGANISSHRWSANYKKELFVSRCRDSWFLCQILKRIKNPPQTVICASACGYYGDRKGEVLTEESTSGKGFLADLCVQWEKSLKPLEELNIRLIHARFGPVLSSDGGILSKLLPLFKWGLGAKIGSGEQMISWIGLDDVLGAFHHILATESLKGPINFTAPHPVSQGGFTKALADSLHRIAFLRAPQVVIKGILGEMGEELLLYSTQAVPQKLLKSGYSFFTPDITFFFKETDF